MSLWVTDPEKSRPELLKQFAGSVQAVSSMLAGKAKFSVSNLMTPIMQRPMNDTQVELFLQPTVTLEVAY